MTKPPNKFTQEIDVPLPPTSRVRGITNAIFFDTETHIETYDDGLQHYPLRLGVAIFVEYTKSVGERRRNVHIFREADEFVDILDQYSRERTMLYVFAHNIGFDIRVLDLFNKLHKAGWESKPPILNERTFIWRVKKGTRRILFLDTANYGISSVARLGDDLGFEKLSIDFDNTSDDELITYCIRDCEILERFIRDWLTFIVTNELGAFKSTLAAQALNIFRTAFYNSDIYLHNHRVSVQLERDAYHGGRTECFYIGKLNTQEYFYVDVNSMYPYVMTQANIPNRLLGYTTNVPLDYLRLRMEVFYCIADVTLKTDIPAYPFRTRTHLLFPTGTFRTYLHHDELTHALEHDHILKIHRCTVYEYSQVFKDYVDFMYSAKVKYTLEHNVSWRLVVKLLMNSLYGKFGQLKPHREMVGYTDKDLVWRMPHTIPEDGIHGQLLAWYGEIWKDYKKGETNFSFPAIAGSITAKARMVLWNYIKQAGIGHVFYMDTDSLICDKVGYERLKPFIDSTTLGSLNLENTADIVQIYGCKDYVFGNSVRHKGIPQSAKHTQPNLWEYTQFQGFQTWLNKGGIGNPVSWTATKSRSHQYNKGVLNGNGSITPIVMDNEAAYRPSINRFYDLWKSVQVD